MDKETSAMDVESRNFKSYEQVPRWWSRLMTAGVLGALLVAIIALGIGIAALEEAKDKDEGVVVAGGTQTSSTAQDAVANNAASKTDSAERALPGTPNYTGYKKTPPTPGSLNVDVIIHGHVSDPYFAHLQKGIDDAAQTVNVNVDYFDPETPDEVGNHEALAERILAARRSLKDGIAVSLMRHTTDLARALREASYDMPVLSLLLDADENDASDVETFANLGFQNEFAGFLAGLRFKEAGVESALCLLNDRTTFGQQSSCTAFEEAIESNQTITRVADPSDRGLIRDRVKDAIEKNEIRGILTIGTTAFAETHAYLDERDLLCTRVRTLSNSKCIMLATFDENEKVLEGILDETVSFAVDSNQYLQGYLSILFLKIRARYHMIPGAGRPVLTGPVMIDTKEDARRRLKTDIMSGKTIDDKEASDLDIRFIVHGKTSDPFWTEVKKGVRRAARETGVSIDFRHPDVERTTMEEILESHVEMIQEAGRDGVDALVLTLPTNDSVLVEAIEDVYNRTNIPIYTITAGHRWFENLPVKAHIGLAEFFEGQGVAARLQEVDVSKVLCVIVEKDNQDLQERCEDIGRDLDDLEVVVLDSFDGNDFHTDMPDRTNTIKSAVSDRSGHSRSSGCREAVMASLEEDVKIQAVVSTGLIATEGVHEALDEAERFCLGNLTPSEENDTCIEFVAYDVGPKVFNYIKAGELWFAVVQQPALQGYLPVYLAMIEVLYGKGPFGIVPTGPDFVDASNVEITEEFYGFLTAN